jgi:hypothetical protein
VLLDEADLLGRSLLDPAVRAALGL